jgi:cytochrome c
LRRADARKFCLALVVAAASLPVSADPATLAEKAMCGMCHKADAQALGPSWTAIAERYSDDDTALATLRARVRSGGSGQWGPAPMPPVAAQQIGDEDLDAVLTWILQR